MFITQHLEEDECFLKFIKDDLIDRIIVLLYMEMFYC